MWFLWFRAAAAQEPPGVTLEEAVASAGSAFAVGVADAERRDAEGRLEQIRAARLPNIGVSGSVNVWNGPQVVSLTPTDAPLDCSAFPAEFAALCEGFGEPLVVRDQVTANLAAHAAVPITGQLAIDHRVQAARAGVDAAEASLRSARVDARHQIEDAWFLALQADLQLQIAEAQVQALGERVRAAEVAFRGGAATRNDVLQAELALARAEQAVIQVRTARDAARGRLGLAMGTPGEPVRPVGDPPPAPEVSEDVDAMVARALQSRPDLAALRSRGVAASEGARAASLDRLPRLSAVAQYLHTEGQGTFALPDAAWVGASLDWTLFDGGQHSAAVRSARAGADVVQARLDGIEAAIRVEIRDRSAAVRAAMAAWQVAERSIGSAEENLRIQDTLRAAGSGTMTDLLAAEAALVEARSRAAAARYEAHRAAAALEHALGGRSEDAR